MTGFRAKLLVKHAVLTASVCLAVAGCTADGHDTGVSLEDSIQPKSQSKGAGMMALASKSPAASSASRSPLAALPVEAGAVGSVRSRDYVDGVRQDIALKGSAVPTIGNGITLLVRTTNQKTLDESVPLSKPSEGAIRSEIGAQFPHISMQVVERDSSNTYGPYGLALGRATGNARCLYMWQWIDANRLPRDAGMTGPASIRVRLCRSDMTFDAMASLVDHLVVGSSAAARQTDRVASNDGPQVIVSPPEAGGPVGEADSTTGSLPDHAEPAKRRTAKHHLRPTRKRVAAAAAPADVPNGPRYMAPLPVSSAPTPAPAALPSDLPPQALLGPKSAR